MRPFFFFIHTEGKCSFIEIPFNVWEETGLNGNIPCCIIIRECSFEVAVAEEQEPITGYDPEETGDDPPLKEVLWMSLDEISEKNIRESYGLRMFLLSEFIYLFHCKFQLGNQKFRCIGINVITAVFGGEDDGFSFATVVIFGLGGFQCFVRNH